MPSTRSWMLTLVSWMGCSYGLTVWVIPPILVHLIGDLKLTPTEAGVILSEYYLMLMVMSVIGGMLADRMNPKRIIGIGIILVGIFSFLRGFASDFISLFIYAAIMNSGFALVYPNIPRILSTWFSPGKLGTNMGFYVTGVGIGLSFAYLATASITYPYFGNWRIVVMTYSLVTVALIPIWWNFAEGRHTAKNEEPYTSSAASINTQVFRELLRSRYTWLCGGYWLCIIIVFPAFMSWIPYILIVQGFTPSESAMVSSLTALTFPAALILPALSDKLGLRKPFLFIFALTAAVTVFLTGFPTGVFLPIIIAVYGVCNWGCFTLVYTVAAETAGDRLAGTGTGFTIMLGQFGGIIGPIIIGYLYDSTQSFMQPILFVTVMAGIAVLFSLLLKETGRRRAQC